MHRISIARVAPILAAVVAAGSTLIAARALADPQRSAAHSDAEPIALEAIVEGRVRRWFDALADPAIEASFAGEFVAEAPLEIALDDEVLADRNALIAWISRLRNAYPRIDFELAEIRVELQGEGRAQARVVFNRRAVDRDGHTHVVRREQSWTFEIDSTGKARVRSIAERRLLPFPGTGPAISGF